MSTLGRTLAMRLAKQVIDIADAELARRRFSSFVDYTNRKFAWSSTGHHALIAESLQSIIDGELTRLYIGMPPRHGKSELGSIRFPAYYLGRFPDRQIIHISYAASLTNEFSRQVRAIVRDDTNFKRLFPGCQLDPERQQLAEWKTTAGGGFKSVGVQGGISGHGAHLMIMDDPHKEGDEQSPATLQAVYDWFTTAAQTRLAPGGAIVFIMTRWHPLDLMGRLLKLAQDEPDADQWTTLVLPALALEGDPLGRAPGAALWPERFDVGRLRQIRAASDRYFEALFQQNPRGTEAVLFSRDDFRLVDAPIYSTATAWTFDLAITDTERSDYTVAQRWSYNQHTRALCLLRTIRIREEWPGVKRMILSLMTEYPADDFCFPRATLELMALQTLRAEAAEGDSRLVSVPQPGDKRARASVLADVAVSGNLYVLNKSENQITISEHIDFGAAPHDDTVDAASVATHHFGLHSEFMALIRDTLKEPTGEGELWARYR